MTTPAGADPLALAARALAARAHPHGRAVARELAARARPHGLVARARPPARAVARRLATRACSREEAA